MTPLGPNLNINFGPMRQTDLPWLRKIKAMNDPALQGKQVVKHLIQKLLSKDKKERLSSDEQYLILSLYSGNKSTSANQWETHAIDYLHGNHSYRIWKPRIDTYRRAIQTYIEHKLDCNKQVLTKGLDDFLTYPSPSEIITKIDIAIMTELIENDPILLLTQKENSGMLIPSTLKNRLLSKAIENRSLKLCQVLEADGAAPEDPIPTLHLTMLSNGMHKLSTPTSSLTTVDVHCQDSHQRSSLHVAASVNDSSMTRFLIAQQANIDIRDSQQQTPLHKASGKAVSHILIDEKADINTQDNKGQTPLHSAVYRGDKDTAETLIHNKADVNAVDKRCQTPLHIAKDESMVTLLLNSGADKTAKDEGGRTPGLLACRNGKPAIAQLLLNLDSPEPAYVLEDIYHQLVHLDNPEGLSGGSDWSYRSLIFFTITCLNKSCDQKKSSSYNKHKHNVYRTFLTHTDTRFLGPYFHYRAITYNFKRNFLRKQPTYFFPFGMDQHAIGIALRFSRSKIKLSLYNRGFGLRYHDQNYGKFRGGVTYSLPRNGFNIYELLYTQERSGKSIEALYKVLQPYRCDEQNAPFMVPQSAGSCSTVWADGYLKHLCYEEFSSDYKKGNPITMADRLKAEILYCEVSRDIQRFYFGRTYDLKHKIRDVFTDELMTRQLDFGYHKICHLDQKISELRTVQKLQRYSLEQPPHIHLSNGETLLHTALEYGDITVMKMCLKAKVNIESKNNQGATPLSIAAGMNNPALLHLLIDAKANIHTKQTKDPYMGFTPLHIAVVTNKRLNIPILLRAGADINANSQNGYTPLHVAVMTDNLVILELLLAADPDVNMTLTGGINNGATPLHLAAKSGSLRMIKILTKGDIGSDVNIHDSQGRTVLHVAVENGDEEMVRFLASKVSHIDATDCHGDSPLMLAKKRNHIGLEKILIQNGATPPRCKDS